MCAPGSLKNSGVDIVKALPYKKQKNGIKTKQIQTTKNFRSVPLFPQPYAKPNPDSITPSSKPQKSSICGLLRTLILHKLTAWGTGSPGTVAVVVTVPAAASPPTDVMATPARLPLLGLGGLRVRGVGGLDIEDSEEEDEEVAAEPWAVEGCSRSSSLNQIS